MCTIRSPVFFVLRFFLSPHESWPCQEHGQVSWRGKNFAGSGTKIKARITSILSENGRNVPLGHPFVLTSHKMCRHTKITLGEFDTSGLGLERSKPGGKSRLGFFRWGPADNSRAGHNGHNDMTSIRETSPLLDSENKTIFTGMIEIDSVPSPKSKVWLALIEAAKRALQ